MESSSQVVVDVKNVWKAFGSQQVLKGLTLQVFKGETLVILGRSGVGKSVLLRMILAMMVPDKGSIRVFDQDLCRMRLKQRLEVIKYVGMLFQESALFDSMTIRENVEFYLTQHPDPLSGEHVGAAERFERVKEALSLVGLEGVLEKYPSELSGGMRKRAALARLIVYRPKLLLYDEPTSGLDPITSMQINRLIQKIRLELQTTSIVVTHDIKSAMEVGSRIAFHNAGVIEFVGTREEFMHAPHPLVRTYIEDAIMKEESIENGWKESSKA